MNRSIVVLLFLTSIAGCGSDSTSEPSTVDLSGAWASFASGDLSIAGDAFEAALVEDPGRGEAHLGLGWVSLVGARDTSDLTSAIASFDAAMSGSADVTDTRAGRALAHWARGDFEEAHADAAAVLDAETAYTFRYRSDVDATLLRLVRSAALLGTGDARGALLVSERIEASTIDPEDESTWQVDGFRRRSLHAVAAARLQAIAARLVN